jgi:MFS family permease
VPLPAANTTPATGPGESELDIPATLSRMETRRWTNPSQPQTLYLATWLLYINAAISALFGAVFSPIGIVIVAAEVFAAFGIANEKRWGYFVGVGIAGVGLAYALWPLLGDIGMIFNFVYLLNIVFPVALFALLIHPLSRDYQRIWFK